MNGTGRGAAVAAEIATSRARADASLELALRWARILTLGVAVLLLLTPGSARGGPVAAAVAVIAGVAVIVAVELLVRAVPPDRGPARAAATGFLGAVEVAAASAAAIAVGEAGWVLLLLPLLSVGLRSGLRALAVAWLVVAAVRLGSLPPLGPVDASSDPVRLLQDRLTQLSLLLLVALVAGFLNGHLVLALEAAATVTARTRWRGQLLETLAAAAPGLTVVGRDELDRVPSLLVELGADGAELWRRGDPDPELLAWAGRPAAAPATPPPPTLLRPGPRPLVLSAGDDPAGDRFLRGRGAVAAASCAVPQQGSETVLVATSDEPPDETVAELLRLLAHAAGAGLRNAALLAEVSRARAEAEHRSNHDMLTGLLNRAAFHRLLAERCAEVAQAPDGRRDHLLFCDLDGFKAVNDELGHEAGDSVLRVFAQRLRDCLGSEATVARLGGDEFTALLPGDEPDPGGRCERLLREAAQPIGVAGGTARVGTSIGVALLTDDPDESLRRADAAMYEAKSAGKGRWQLWRAGPGIPVQSPPDVAAHARRARRGQPAGADP